MLSSHQILYSSLWILIPFIIFLVLILIIKGIDTRKSSKSLDDEISKMESDRRVINMKNYIESISKEK